MEVEDDWKGAVPRRLQDCGLDLVAFSGWGTSPLACARFCWNSLNWTLALANRTTSAAELTPGMAHSKATAHPTTEPRANLIRSPDDARRRGHFSSRSIRRQVLTRD